MPVLKPAPNSEPRCDTAHIIYLPYIKFNDFFKFNFRFIDHLSLRNYTIVHEHRGWRDARIVNEFGFR
jgi:hypothetical protein